MGKFRGIFTKLLQAVRIPEKDLQIRDSRYLRGIAALLLQGFQTDKTTLFKTKLLPPPVFIKFESHCLSGKDQTAMFCRGAAQQH